MKTIVSKKAKKKQKGKKFEEDYWKTIYPDNYVDVLVNEDILNEIKIASRKKQVSLVGTLKKTKDNYVYLDISNNIMNGLYSMLPEADTEKPPYNNKGFNNIGAHISVIYIDEYKDNNLEDIKEIGKEFKFKTGIVYSVNPEGWKEMSEIWFMDVDSPELEKMRQEYGLPKFIDNHNFHISFAVKRK